MALERNMFLNTASVSSEAVSYDWSTNPRGKMQHKTIPV